MTISMRSVLCLIIGALLLAAAPTPAQVNTEKLRLGRTDQGIGGQVGIDYSMEMGNTEISELGLNADFVARTGSHLFFWLNEYARIHSDDGTIKNEGFTHGRYNHELSGSVVWEVFAQASYNRSADLEERLLSGTGPRFIFIRDSLRLLAAGGAAMYEYEELVDGGVSELIRASSYISVGWRKPSRFSISATTYFQPSLKRLTDLRVLSEIQLSMNLWRHITFSAAVNYAYDSEPPDGVKEYDLAIKNGFRFNF